MTILRCCKYIFVSFNIDYSPEDAERLKKKKGRRMIARSIFLGINDYFIENPIEGTFAEDNPSHLNYEIQKGDVLSMEFEEVPGAAHHVPLDKPKEIIDIIKIVNRRLRELINQ